MTKHTREKWAARVREWRASGKSAEDFVADKDYEVSSLRWAASQVGAETARPGTPKKAPTAPVRRRLRPSRASAPKAPAPRFAPVRVRRTPAPAAELVVEVAGVRIRVTRGTDITLLGDVVRALQGSAR